MKKLKHKIIIPIATALSSVALLAPCACATTSKVVNSDNNSSIVNSIKYTTITYNTDSGTTTEGEAWSVSLVGSNIVKARQNVLFSTVLKPEAVHSLNWEFQGWSTAKGDKTKIIKDTDTIGNVSKLSLYPIFEARAEALTIVGKDKVVATSDATYTVDKIPLPAVTNLEWSIPTKSMTSGSVSIDLSSGALTTSLDAVGTATIKVTDTYTGVSDTKDIKIIAPYTESDGIWTQVTNSANETTEWVKLTISDLCDSTKTSISTTKVDGTTAGTAITKSTFTSDMYIGDYVTSIPNDFCLSMTGYNGNIIFQDATSKCALIGKNFMDGCTSFNKALTLPTAATYIDDEFLNGCTGFNATLTLSTKTSYIGENFMYGCSAFAQNLSIPSTVSYVGDSFMTNCNGMIGTLTIDCEPEVFKVPTASYSETLTTTSASSAAYTTGIKLASNVEGNVVEFIKRFPNRDSASPYRNIKTSEVKDITSCTWAELTEWATLLEAGDITQSQFCAHFGKTQMSDFVGVEKDVTINGYAHTMRITDTLHDTIAEGEEYEGEKATFTFDTVTVLSDTSGNAITSQWNSTLENYDYTNSTLRANLTGNGTASKKAWTKTALEIIKENSSDLGNSIKKVTKSVAVSTDSGVSYHLASYDDYLYPLTAKEANRLIEDPNQGTCPTNEGTTYNYWSTHTSYASTLKKCANGSAAAFWWLASPVITDATSFEHKTLACDFHNTGMLTSGYVTNTASVSFSFSV